MYRQNCVRVPYTYEQCMADCQALGGYPYDCKVLCRQYKTKPWYMQCTGPMAYTPSTPYSMSQPVPYSPHPYYYPYSHSVSPYYPVNPMTYFTMQPTCPPCHARVKICDRYGCSWQCIELLDCIP